MNAGIITSILESLIRALPVDIVKSSLDALLDKVESLIEKTDNKWDDRIVLPLIKALRAQLGITEETGSKYADPTPTDVNVTVTVKDQTKGPENVG